MRTLLVTGGAGFIGGNYVLRSLALDPELRIINLDLLTYAGNLDTLKPLLGNQRHVFIHGDITDAERVNSLLEQYAPVAVVNFAAESHVDRSIDAPAEFVLTNVVGTLNLLQCSLDWWKKQSLPARQAFRFLHVSTDEVYGSLGETGAFCENTPYAPNSPYAASKAGSDHLVRAFHHTYDFPTLTTNCSNNYGPYQFPEKLIPLIILNALEYKPLPVYGDGQQVRDWLFVQDHVDAINTVLDRGAVGEVYNVGGSCERTNLQVVHSICDVLDQHRPDKSRVQRRELLEHVADRPGHDRRYAIDASKAKRELGWKPEYDFKTALKRTIVWYLEHDDWRRAIQAEGDARSRRGLSAQSRSATESVSGEADAQ